MYFLFKTLNWNLIQTWNSKWQENICLFLSFRTHWSSQIPDGLSGLSDLPAPRVGCEFPKDGGASEGLEHSKCQRMFVEWMHGDRSRTWSWEDRFEARLLRKTGLWVELHWGTDMLGFLQFYWGITYIYKLFKVKSKMNLGKCTQGETPQSSLRTLPSLQKVPFCCFAVNPYPHTPGSRQLLTCFLLQRFGFNRISCQ